MAARHGVVVLVPPRTVDSAPVQLGTPGLWSSDVEAAQFAGYVALVLKAPFVPDSMIAAQLVVTNQSVVITLSKEA